MTSLVDHIITRSCFKEINEICTHCKIRSGTNVSLKGFKGEAHVDWLIEKVIALISKNPHFSEDERVYGKSISIFFIKYHGRFHDISKYNTLTVYDIQKIFNTYTKIQWDICFPGFALPFPKSTAFEYNREPVRYDPVEQMKAHTTSHLKAAL